MFRGGAIPRGEIAEAGGSGGRVAGKYWSAAPNATAEQLARLREKTEQYCVVMQTLLKPPAVTSVWTGRSEMAERNSFPRGTQEQ